MADDADMPSVKLEGSFGDAQARFRMARIDEALSTLTEMRVEFEVTAGRLEPRTLLGTRLKLELPLESGATRCFQGLVIAVDYLGQSQGFDLWGADVRPWLWFLTRAANNRIFQNLSTPDIVQQVFNDHGFGDHKLRLSESYPERDYCVQYGESDFAFVSRLLEEEGICYYFDHAGNSEELVLADGMGGHDPLPDKDTLTFKPRARETSVEEGDVFEWGTAAGVQTGRVSLVDYDMLKPNADLGATNAIQRTDHAYAEYERYAPDARYDSASLGETRARVRMEGLSHRAERFDAAANAPQLLAGGRFTLLDHPEEGDSAEYLVITATHFLRGGDEDGSTGPAGLQGIAHAPLLRYPDRTGRYVCRFAAAPSAEPFRPAQRTPWPDLGGLHTAVVTGPKGEEIHTDAHGRIKVQFHWDRDGKKDEATSCWVRCVLPWTGKGWGMFGIPRIGQEVVIQFERGNPDRPICTGMLYNGANTPPYPLPDDMTMSGVRTNVTKGGGGFHEFVFEDKKGEEYIRMVSEKDYVQTIKNNATVTIGTDKKDPGDLTRTVHRHQTETIATGNHDFHVRRGDQRVRIGRNHIEQVGGTSDTTIKGDTTLTIQDGDYTETLEMGSFSQTIEMGDRASVLNMGNDTTTLKLGNMSVKCDVGKITMEAMQAIELKVMGSSIKIDPSGVTIKGPMIKLDAQAMVQIKAAMTDVKGNGLLVLKGGLMMIN